MSDDWKPGDLALCVNNTPNRLDPKAGLLARGRIYPVGSAGIREDGVFSLAFYELKSGPKKGWAFTASRFRKIKPLTDEEREQFFADLNVREPSHA